MPVRFSYSANYTNGARNIALLTGYARKLDDERILLMQSAGAAGHYVIQVRPGIRPIRPNIAYTVRCHVTASRDPETKQSRIALRAIGAPQRASVSATPGRIAMLGALASGLAKDTQFDPFAGLEETREAVARGMASRGFSAEAIEELLASADKAAGSGQRFANHVVLSGFVGHKAFLPDEDGRGGTLVFTVLQSADTDSAIPVHVRTTDPRLVKSLRPMQPVNVVGSIRNALPPGREDDAGRHLILDVHQSDVGAAQAADFQDETFPTWWTDAVNAYAAMRRAGSAPRANATPPADPPAAPSAAPSVPAGVADKLASLM